MKEFRDQFSFGWLPFTIMLVIYIFLLVNFLLKSFLFLFSFTAEAERIRKCRGRVFALQDEPEVARVWLPNNDSPGLAMARAFGDFCLKDFGLISVPDISYRRVTEKDEFIVLATDGVGERTKENYNLLSSALLSVPFSFLHSFVALDKTNVCNGFSVDLGCAIKQRSGRHNRISPNTIICGSVPG